MTDTLDPFPILYILMRNDLASMNPGKACAQASHAANAFALAMTSDPKNTLYQNWACSTIQGFGTVIVLAVNEAQMREVDKAAKKFGYMADIIHDPTYPLVDGDVVHYLAIDTCGYVFVDKNDPIKDFLLGDLPLHP